MMWETSSAPAVAISFKLVKNFQSYNLNKYHNDYNTGSRSSTSYDIEKNDDLQSYKT